MGSVLEAEIAEDSSGEGGNLGAFTHSCSSYDARFPRKHLPQPNQAAPRGCLHPTQSTRPRPPLSLRQVLRRIQILEPPLAATHRWRPSSPYNSCSSYTTLQSLRWPTPAACQAAVPLPPAPRKTSLGTLPPQQTKRRLHPGRTADSSPTSPSLARTASAHRRNSSAGTSGTSTGINIAHGCVPALNPASIPAAGPTSDPRLLQPPAQIRPGPRGYPRS